MFSTTLYRASPAWIQSQLVSIWGWTRSTLREGSKFRQIQQEIDKTQWYSRDQLRELQLRRLLATVQHAATNVPYYRELFARERIRAEDIRSFEDYRQVPYLEKSVVQQQAHRLVAENIKGRRISVTTSGSTGTPLRLFQNLDAVNREHAFVWRQLLWSGYRPGEPRAWLRGDMIVPANCRKPPYWRKNAGEQMLMLSSYHLSTDTAPAYIAVLQDYDPVMIQAYPSAISFLARYLESNNQVYQGRLRSIVVTSETLSTDDAELIARRFNCGVFEQYGSAERVTMIQTCEHGSRHIDADYGYTELLPMDDGRFEIVGTGFNNPLMPLLRYRVGDSLELPPEPIACPCGRDLPVIKKVHGRLDDYIKTPDGRQIARLGFIFQGIANIAEAQIVQQKIDEIVLRVVPLQGFGDPDRSKLITNARTRIGDGMNIRLETVDAIPRTRSGKLRTVICSV